MKYCRKCFTEKPEEAFSKHSGRPDGLQPHCKDCKKQTYQDNKPFLLSQMKDYREANKEWINKRINERQKANRPAANERNRKWAALNKASKAAGLAKYRAAKDDRTPSWLTEEHYSQIKEKYWLAADLRKVTGEVYHVDHIIPLRGENVCGLHVPWNLQVLPMDINCSKSNSMEQMAIAAENGL